MSDEVLDLANELASAMTARSAPESRVVLVAQRLIDALDRGHAWRKKNGHSVKEIDFAIGATLELRSALDDVRLAARSPSRTERGQDD